MGKGKRSSSLLIILTISVCAVFVAIVLTGLSLRMDQTVHLRYTAHALPIALSWKYLGLPFDFSACEGIQSILVQLAPKLTSAEAWDDAMRQAVDDPIGISCEKLVFLPFDDKGYTLLTASGLQIFGPTISSIYWTWILLFGLTVICGWQLVRQRVDGLVVLCCSVLGLWTALFALPVSSELREVTNPRAVGLLSLVAFIILVYVMLANVSVSAVGALSIVVETCVVTLSYLSRSSEVWQLIALVSIALATMAYRRWFRRESSPANQFVVGAVVICLVSVQLFFAFVLNPVYASNFGNGRLTWHNIGIGFVENPAFASIIGTAVSDQTMFKTVEELSSQLGIRDEVFLHPEEIPLLQNPIRNFLAYEDLAREIVFQMVAQDPYEGLATFLYWKPMRLGKELSRAISPSNSLNQSPEYGWASENQRRTSSLTFNIFRPLAIVVCAVLVGCLVSWRARIPRGAMFATMAVGLLGSTVPSILAYPAYHTLGTVFAFLAASLYLWATIVVATLIRWFFQRRGSLGSTPVRQD